MIKKIRFGDPEDDEEVKIETRTKKKHRDILISVKDIQDELVDTIYSDQMGKFSVRSREGNRYIMVICEIYSGEIMVEPMRKWMPGEMVKSYQVLVYWLKNCGATPKRHILDIETSEEFKDATQKHKTTFHLIPSHDHCRNRAKKDIQTFKNHLVSILCDRDENLPMKLWDFLLQQSKITLNLIRQSRLFRTISAYAHLYGP